jgi:hypothetical protein
MPAAKFAEAGSTSLPAAPPSHCTFLILWILFVLLVLYAPAAAHPALQAKDGEEEVRYVHQTLLPALVASSSCK